MRPTVKRPSSLRTTSPARSSDIFTRSAVVGRCGPKHCDPCALLTQTRHTPATIRIVNRVYKRDFKLLGYAMLDGEPQEVLSHCLRRGLNHSLSQAVLAPHEATASAA